MFSLQRDETGSQHSSASSGGDSGGGKRRADGRTGGHTASASKPASPGKATIYLIMNNMDCMMDFCVFNLFLLLVFVH